VAVGIVAFFSLGGGVIAASGNSIPGELLYPVKIGTERARLAFTFSDVSNAKLEIAFAERRVEEISELVRKGRAEQVSEVVPMLARHLDNAVQVMQAKGGDGETQGLLALLQQSAIEQLSLLESIAEEAPEEAKAAVGQALETSGEGYGTAIEVVANKAPAPVLTARLGTLQVRATDPPPPEVDQVLVEVTNIQVHQAGKGGRWITIVSEPVTFDLIRVAEVQKFLGSLPLEPGVYTQIKLEVIRATVVVGGKEYPVQVPSGKLKLVRPFQVKEGETTVVLLDFDGSRSLKITGAGQYMLKPTVKLLVPKDEGKPKDKGKPEGKKTKVDIEGTIESVTQTDSGTIVVVDGQEVVLPPGTEIGNLLKEGMAIEVETVVQPGGPFLATEVEAEEEDGAKVELKEDELEIDKGTVDSLIKDDSGAVIGVMVNGVQVMLGPDSEIKGTLTAGGDVKVEAVRQPDGSFLATEVKAEGEDKAEKEAKEEAKQAEE
jgi:hypothetical protein